MFVNKFVALIKKVVKNSTQNNNRANNTTGIDLDNYQSIVFKAKNTIWNEIG